ncbi:MAG TPA: hypothetical protein VNU68_30530 [Verrucomicrobiae bacterium]|nr:hypothetical protein [Verrucomicrobiae bacterium]
MKSLYKFQNLSGVAPATWTNELHFIGTGMVRDYDLGWMSTAANRRDFSSGISGSQFSANFETSLRELGLTKPYPDNSYHITLNATLRLLDLRSAPDANFSGHYYNADRSISCQIVEANRDYLRKEGYDGILRVGKVAHDDNKIEDVVALTPETIGKLAVKQIEPLGTRTVELNIVNPDGSKAPMRNFYPKA